MSIITKNDNKSIKGLQNLVAIVFVNNNFCSSQSFL